MHSDRFIDSTAPLRALGGQRVWSLMISLFGDLAQGEGDRIDGPVLSAIMASLQIKPEAARVALHRLRNDGWITSAKSGRIRQHSLTAKGRAESAIASPRIYAAPDAIPDQWQLVLVENSDAQNTVDMTALGFTALTTRAYLGPVGITAPVGALALRGAEVPEWLRREAAPAGLREDYARLDLALSALTRDLAEIPALSPVEVAVLRCLIVHNWRRLVLRHPPLPRALLPDDWPGHPCHRQVVQLLDQFPRPDPPRIGQQSANA